jgi:hypothetical protein
MKRFLPQLGMILFGLVLTACVWVPDVQFKNWWALLVPVIGPALALLGFGLLFIPDSPASTPPGGQSPTEFREKVVFGVAVAVGVIHGGVWAYFIWR